MKEKNYSTEPKVLTKKEIEDWCEMNLFGPRVVEGIKIPLSPTQEAIKRIAVEIIRKWEGIEE